MVIRKGKSIHRFYPWKTLLRRRVRKAYQQLNMEEELNVRYDDGLRLETRKIFSSSRTWI